MARTTTGDAFPASEFSLDGFDTTRTPKAPEIRAQADRILNSKAFVRSARIQRLLTYLVESVLTEQGQRLKESTIGIDVFDRPPDYDPKTDSIVRVEMRRTRSKLGEYYLNEGQSDDVLIWLDKGSYIPVFASRVQDASKRQITGAPVGHLSLEADASSLQRSVD